MSANEESTFCDIQSSVTAQIEKDNSPTPAHRSHSLYLQDFRTLNVEKNKINKFIP